MGGMTVLHGRYDCTACVIFPAVMLMRPHPTSSSAAQNVLWGALEHMLRDLQLPFSP